MPIVQNREYRQMAQPLAAPMQPTNKRFDTDYYVEGYATTFDTPYLLFEYDGKKYYEVIDRHALDSADMSDVIMQYNHAGRVYARNKMAQEKSPTLLLEISDAGFFNAANLGLTAEARGMYEDIAAGLIYKMSWAFTVAEHSIDSETRTRRILRVKKVYDVSAVSYPANADTEISARSCFDGVIEAEKRETLARNIELFKLQLLFGGFKK